MGDNGQDLFIQKLINCNKELRQQLKQAEKQIDYLECLIEEEQLNEIRAESTEAMIWNE